MGISLAATIFLLCRTGQLVQRGFLIAREPALTRLKPQFFQERVAGAQSAGYSGPKIALGLREMAMFEGIAIAGLAAAVAFGCGGARLGTLHIKRAALVRRDEHAFTRRHAA